MKINMDFYQRIAPINWLAQCGENMRPNFYFPVQWLEDRMVSLQSMFSTEWANANNHARGCLTSYLAKHHYDSYAGYWNKLTIQSQSLLEESIGKRVSASLESGDWPASLARTPLPEITPAIRASIGKHMADLFAAEDWSLCLSSWIVGHANMAVLEMTYRCKFPKAPVFFEHLLEVYEAGHLPCGWEGDLEAWPEGKLIVH